jgi:hypothetical protein
MSKFTTPMLFASAVLLAAVPAAAQYSSHDYNQSGPDRSVPDSYDQSGDGSYAPADQDQRPRHQRGMRMSVEQKAMWRAEIRHQMQNIPHEQRKAYRQQLRAELRSMGPEQRQQKFAEMERHWNALPADQRDRMLARVSRHNGHRGRGQQGDSQYLGGNGQYHDAGDRYRDRGGPSDSGADQDEGESTDQ